MIKDQEVALQMLILNILRNYGNCIMIIFTGKLENKKKILPSCQSNTIVGYNFPFVDVKKSVPNLLTYKLISDND